MGDNAFIGGRVAGNRVTIALRLLFPEADIQDREIIAAIGKGTARDVE